MSNLFIPLHFAEQLTVINPAGTVGIVTLWSRVDFVLRRLRENGMDLSQSESPIAVLGTLYGNGLRELLRNLLHNPQIDTIVFFGRNRSGSAEELAAFFSDGLEACAGGSAVYETVERPDGTGEIPSSVRIRGTSRIMDNLVRPEHFGRPPRFFSAGNPQEPSSILGLKDFLNTYVPCAGPVPERKRIPLPLVRITNFPSNPGAHTICAADPLTAWKELIYRLHRFGIPVQLAKGERRELQNVKVVVEEPSPVPAASLQPYGLTLPQLERYQRDILSDVLHADETYTYGNRLRSHFGLDSLEAVAERLTKDPEDRKSYVVIWDPRRDLVSEKGHPCLVSLFFRRFQGRLTLTATFRTHNALDAWLVNFHGLMAILNHVALRCKMQPGPITVNSHSITIDTRQLDRASLIATKSELEYNEDPMGYFHITLDEDAILVEHRTGDITLSTYRHAKASHIQHEIYRDRAVSDINHAIYLGRQLARAEICLREGREFIQE